MGNCQQALYLLIKCFENYFPTKEDLWTGNYSFTVTFINEKIVVTFK